MDKTPEFREEMLAELWQDLLAEMKRTVTTLEVDKIQELIAKVGQQNPIVAGKLAEFAENHRYDLMLNMLENVGKDPSPGLMLGGFAKGRVFLQKSNFPADVPSLRR